MASAIADPAASGPPSDFAGYVSLQRAHCASLVPTAAHISRDQTLQLVILQSQQHNKCVHSADLDLQQEAVRPLASFSLSHLSLARKSDSKGKAGLRSKRLSCGSCRTGTTSELRWNGCQGLQARGGPGQGGAHRLTGVNKSRGWR